MITMKCLGYLVLLISTFVLTSCNTHQEVTKEYLSENLTISDHIKYFGFSMVNTYFDDPLDNEYKTNYVNEVSAFTNIADVVVFDPNVSISEDITNVINEGLLVYIHVFELFFEIDNTDNLNTTDFRIREDYQERWIQFCDKSEIDQHINDIAFIYLGEEPTWNGITYEELKKASDCIKEYDGRLKVAVIEAYPAVEELIIPDSVDYVGFDKYAVKDPYTNKAYNELMDVIRQKMDQHQKILLVMDTHYIDSLHKEYGGIDTDDMGEVAKSYSKLANDYDEIIGIIGYCWPSGFDSKTALGGRDMPQHVIDIYETIGRLIIEN